jgi:cell wall assembly regulator SMI1
MASKLSALFAQIDTELAAKLPATAKSLRPPAKKKDLVRLAKLFGGKLPADLAAWFAWHDGQDEKAFESLIPDTNRSALSCDRAIGIHAFLTDASPNECMQPWKTTWIPLFDSGGGDHECYDRDTGKIITWYHDDASRPTAYKSLTALVDAIAKGYAKMKKPGKVLMPGKALKWKTAKPPSKLAVAKLPIGSAYAYKTKYAFMGSGQDILVKIDDNKWLHCFGGDLVGAIKHWREHAKSPPPESAGYYKDDSDVAFEFREWRKTLKQLSP